MIVLDISQLVFGQRSVGITAVCSDLDLTIRLDWGVDPMDGVEREIQPLQRPDALLQVQIVHACDLEFEECSEADMEMGFFQEILNQG